MQAPDPIKSAIQCHVVQFEAGGQGKGRSDQAGRGVSRVFENDFGSDDKSMGKFNRKYEKAQREGTGRGEGDSYCSRYFKKFQFKGLCF